MYLLIKYIKSVLWGVAKCLSYIDEARCLKVKLHQNKTHCTPPHIRHKAMHKQRYVKRFNNISSLLEFDAMYRILMYKVSPLQARLWPRGWVEV